MIRVIVERELVDTQLALAHIDRLALEVAQGFTQPVYIEVLDASWVRAVEIHFSTRGRGRSVQPVEDAVRSALGHALGMTRRPATGGVVSGAMSGAKMSSSSFIAALSNSSASAASTKPVTMKDMKAAIAAVANQPPPPPPPPPAFSNAMAALNFSMFDPDPGKPPEPMFMNTPVYGFRAWHIAEHPGQALRKYVEGQLEGKVEPWPEATKVAYCFECNLSRTAIEKGHAPAGHDAPHWGCHCGIYVTSSPDHQSVRGADMVVGHDLGAAWGVRSSPRAVGIVELTGVIVEHDSGARGQRGEIRVLWVPEDWKRRVQRLYPEVEVIGVPEFRERPVERLVLIEPRAATWIEEGETPDAATLSYDTELVMDTVRDARRRLIDNMTHTKEKLEEPWLRLADPSV